MKEVTIIEYVWAGKWGPFKIKTRCKDCDLAWAVLQSMKGREFKGNPVNIEQKPWLDSWIYCILRGAYHAPILMVNGRLFHQFSHKDPLFDRKKLAARVEALLKR